MKKLQEINLRNKIQKKKTKRSYKIPKKTLMAAKSLKEDNY